MNTLLDKSLILNLIKSHYEFKTDAEFAKFLGIKPQTLSTWHARNTFDGDLLYSKCEQIDGNFIHTGKGQISRGTQNDSVYEPKEEYLLRTDRKKDLQLVPLYDFKASAGLTKLFSDKHPNVLDHISIPNLPKVDGAISITGDSMYPLLKSGDIVMYKIYSTCAESIFWGEMYLLSYDLEGDMINTVKYVQKSDKGDQFIKLVSYNSYHCAKDVSLSQVKALALVKASIRINTMA